MPVKMIPLSTAMANRPDVNWLADGRILRGSTNVLYGDDGLCKSWLAASLCAAMSNPELGGVSILGEAVLGEAEQPGYMDCLYLCGEDPYVADKLVRCGATDRVRLIDTRDDPTEEYSDPYSMRIGDPDFESLCAQYPGALVVLDPVKAYAPRGIKWIDELSVQTLIHQPLRKLSMRYGTTFLLICHTNKTNGSGRDKLSGSAELSNGSRSVLAVGPFTYTDTGDVDTIWLGYTKSSLKDSHGRYSETLEFRLGSCGPELLGTIPYSAQQLQQQAAASKAAAARGGEAPTRGRPKSSDTLTAKASDLILEALQQPPWYQDGITDSELFSYVKSHTGGRVSRNTYVNARRALAKAGLITGPTPGQRGPAHPYRYVGGDTSSI